MARRTFSQLFLLAAVVALVVAFFMFDLGDHLTLEYLKASRERFQELYTANRFEFISVFFSAYVLMAALSLPGAAVMTLAGGAIFGFWLGLLVTSLASSLGATLACAVARYVIGRRVQERFGERLRKLNQGVEREGAFYLFTLRLIPAVPFWLINLGMGLTQMRLFTFYRVSQIGMLPGAAVFVNAGNELGSLDSLGDALSPSLIGSFVLLGIFPLAAKKIMTWVRARRGLTPEAAPATPPATSAGEADGKNAGTQAGE